MPVSQPLPEGQQRKWEDWELPYYIGMGGAFVLYAVIYLNRPNYNHQEWARIEALKRIDAAAAEEE